jgi:hypothetical protein
MALRDEMALPSGVAGLVDLAELAAAASLPCGVIGPLDFAPLARDAWMRSTELIFLAVLWQAAEPVWWKIVDFAGNFGC